MRSPEVQSFSRTDRRSGEIAAVTKIAKNMVAGMRTNETLSRIGEVHKAHASSIEIQRVIQPIAATLGFENECEGLFGNGPVSGLRPDYYRKVGRSGVILEVERGSTLTSNRDILDLWKCHICPIADHLILVVPFERRGHFGKLTKPFEAVCRRLYVFFQPENYVNVHSVHIIGY